MTLSTGSGIFVLAALAVGVGLWAAYVTVNSSTRGADWALGRLPSVLRGSLVGVALGVALAFAFDPAWLGFGVAYLAGVVAWTARSVAKGLARLQEAGAYEPLPLERQAALVGRVGLWLLVVAALGIAVALIDIESRGAIGVWDFALVGVVLVSGVMYRKRAGELEAAAE